MEKRYLCTLYELEVYFTLGRHIYGVSGHL